MENLSDPNVNSDNRPPRPLEESSRLQLHNLVLQQQVCREQLNGLILQCLQSPQARSLQDRIDELTKGINALTERIYADCELDPKIYQLNVETGEFVKKRG